jgi:hypothetical protein
MFKLAYHCSVKNWKINGFLGNFCKVHMAKRILKLELCSRFILWRLFDADVRVLETKNQINKMTIIIVQK